MRKKAILCAFGPVALIALFILSATFACGSRADTDLALSQARFEGLTRIVAAVDADLDGIDAERIVITKPDGAVVPAEKIVAVQAGQGSLTVVISADQFGRITSEGTTIATKVFKRFKASSPVPVERRGEPAANGHIIGTSSGLDEGWNINRTDLSYVDPVTGEKGLYSATDVTPDRDENGNPVAWNDGRVTVPVHKAKTMLMLLVEFPDRLAANAEDPYKDTAPYLEYLKGTVEWFARASYGQFRFSLASPQVEKNLGWIKMDKNATQYRGGEGTIPMHAYIAEACQKAYDNWGIKADDYDQLVIMPPQGKSGLGNGPAYIHRKPTGPGEPNMNRVVYVDKDKKPHYIATAITAGNDLFRWGYRWAIHESGHTFGLPDLYSYEPVIDGQRIGSFFFCGGWDMMGNIAGHSTDFLGWVKWKLHWLRDDQADVVTMTADQPTTHYLTPVETPGGTKIVVVRTGLNTAYVAEFRTRLGINALDDRGKFSGVLIYRIDATRSGARGRDYTGQVISKKYYNDPRVGGPQNLTGLWRPIENGLDGYDSPDCCWQPGDVFSDPATGVTIGVEAITRYNAADPSASPYTADDTALVTVRKTADAPLELDVALSNARLKGLTALSFDTNVELQNRIANDRNGSKSFYIREDSRFYPKSLVITKADGSVVPTEKIVKITVNPANVEVTLAEGAFAGAAEAAGATVATRPWYNFGPADAVPVSVQE